MIVDVQCDDHSVQIAQLLNDLGDSCEVKFLERIHSSVFNFSDRVEMIERGSISGFYDVEKLEDTGIYVHTQRGYELIDDSEDEDFTCSDVESEESDDVSLIDEEEDLSSL
jgi:hypothetical protein|tara:strand:- start:2290 stop:2622 length:333 start_codon:yes stop_codon:yes gene_type:complete